MTAPPVVVRFGPDRRLTALAGAGALVAVLLAATAVDGSGRLLFAVAAVLLAGYAVGDLLFFPRLTADRDGLRIRTPALRATLPWPEVEQVRVDVRTRHGLRSTTLEIDAGPTLVVLTRRALGTDPQTACELVNACDPRPWAPTG